tara:strand:- start:164 stop:301 length:138 start_codon:yes stop_codon:yes gene_type:complete
LIIELTSSTESVVGIISEKALIVTFDLTYFITIQNYKITGINFKI